MKTKAPLLLLALLPGLLAAQTLEQQLKQAQAAGVLPPNMQNPVGPFGAIAPGESTYDRSPRGVGAALGISPIVEEVKMGSLSTYFPKGYGREPQHFGIWNAVPFVVFNNENMDLRFGLVFEHRQVGFVPDDWVSTTVTGSGLPEISFLIPKTKTFLNFARGTSQWRSTVLLTDNQIRALSEYSKDRTANANDPYSQIYTVTHRFIDSSTRLYLVGVRHKEFFQAMLKLYEDFALNKNVKTFKNSNVFPKNGFFDDLTLQEVTTQTTNVVTTITEDPALPAEEDAYAEEAYPEDAYAEEYLDEGY